MDMSTKDSIRARTAGICWLIGLVTFVFVIVTANNGDSSFPLKTAVIISLFAGVPQGIGFALSLGHDTVGGGLSSLIWGLSAGVSSYIMLTNSDIKIGIASFVIGCVLTLLPLLSTKKNA